MADAPVIRIGENSPEYVAYLLMGQVNAAEDTPKKTRKQILDLYSECLLTVRSPGGHLKER